MLDVKHKSSCSQGMNKLPTSAAGLTCTLWGWVEVIALIDAKQEAPKKRGPYKKRIAA